MGTMTPEELRDMKADDLRSDAIREMELDELAFLHEAGEHDERPQVSECPDCETRFEDAKAEHAWMGRAVQVQSESMDLARRDLDMENASEPELMHAIQTRLK